jgi:hypothetical protein
MLNARKCPHATSTSSLSRITTTTTQIVERRSQNQRSSNRDYEPKVRGTWLKENIALRRRHATALSIIRDVIRSSSNLEYGTVDRTLVVEVDKKEVWRTVPVACA